MREESGVLVPAVWLRGATVGLRAVERSDAAVAQVWSGHDLPMSPAEAERTLVDGERVPWGHNPVVRLMVVSLATGDVLGSIVIRRTQSRTSRLEVVLGGVDAGERGKVEREVLKLVVPWILGEMGLMTVTMAIPADATSSIAAAESAGMRQVVRLREAIARSGRRVDLLTFERVNPDWGRSWREVRDGRS